MIYSYTITGLKNISCMNRGSYLPSSSVILTVISAPNETNEPVAMEENKWMQSFTSKNCQAQKHVCLPKHSVTALIVTIL